MDLTLHIDLTRTEWINDLLRLLRQANKKMEGIDVSLETLTAAVEANTSASDSVIVLIAGLVTELQAALAANDPAAVQALVDQLSANTSELVDAVTANTPPVDPPVDPSV